PSGRIEKDAVQVNAPWADYSAKFGADDRISGVAIFDHPTNPNHPTPWLLRHYGVLNPTWPGLVPVALRQGQRVKLQYRLVIHRGDPTTARVAELFASWTPAR
ncbi:MAG: PmoA family protein, partial [Verrucomicrobiae bacterium]|nr:PmoA family protein [Verrucomicrobiae bacterium]